MPHQNKNATEQQTENKLTELLQAGELAVTTQPVFVCGVNRRLNTGNYEHLDIYAGIALPVAGASTEDMEALLKKPVNVMNLLSNGIESNNKVRNSKMATRRVVGSPSDHFHL